MADPNSDMFDVVGDPDALPDSFFDALAGLLLDISEKGHLLHDAEEEAA